MSCICLCNELRAPFPAPNIAIPAVPLQGLVELTDRLSIQKAIAMRLPYEPPVEKSSKGAFARIRSSKAAQQQPSS